MIAVDTNILVHAHRVDSDGHDRASRAITDLANSGRAWAIPWPCIHEFLAIVTHPRVFAPPTPRERACDQVDAWLESPSLALLGEDAEYWPALRASIVTGRIAGAAVHDARIATLCLRHGVAELWTADRDFSRFPGLALHNPLVSSDDEG